MSVEALHEYYYYTVCGSVQFLKLQSKKLHAYPNLGMYMIIDGCNY